MNKDKKNYNRIVNQERFTFDQLKKIYNPDDVRTTVVDHIVPNRVFGDPDDLFIHLYNRDISEVKIMDYKGIKVAVVEDCKEISPICYENSFYGDIIIVDKFFFQLEEFERDHVIRHELYHSKDRKLKFDLNFEIYFNSILRKLKSKKIYHRNLKQMINAEVRADIYAISMLDNEVDREKAIGLLKRLKEIPDYIKNEIYLKNNLEWNDDFYLFYTMRIDRVVEHFSKKVLKKYI